VNPAKVFISYSHDSDEHRDRVLGLSERLRADGIETLLDQYVNGAPAGGWPRWMLNQLDAAAFVLVVCTETYYRRFRGFETGGKGKGVDWEGALITQEIYDSRSTSLKFVPVLFSLDAEPFIPEPLRSGGYHLLTSESGYAALYDFLLGQAGVEPGLVGTVKTKARRKGAPLTFITPPPTSRTSSYDISRITEYAPAELIGREEELKFLRNAWTKTQSDVSKRPRVLTFVALGGEGKTSLVAKWSAELAEQNWPGCDAAFAWSFYSQGTRDQQAASSDFFLKEALSFFGDDADKAFAASPAGAFEKGQRLAHVVGQRRNLLILDGLEPLQYPPTPPHHGALKDQGLTALLKGLATASRGLCVVTTRYSLPDLKTFRHTTAPEAVLEQLSTDAGVHLLQQLGVRKESGTKAEFETLVEDVKGHALTLTLLGAFLKRAHNGDIRKRDRVKFEKADEKIDGGRAFRTMAAYEQWLLSGGEEGRREVAVLRLMGLFDRPADAGSVAALRGEPIPGLTEPLAGLPDEDWDYCLSGLEAARLLTVNRDAGVLDSLDTHPHIRAYFAKQLSDKHVDAWRAGHRRLYEYLCASTPDQPEPTLKDLQPLYQAVAHGCQAGLLQEACDDVYFSRIRRGEKAYSSKKLGAYGSELGALACFFLSPWSHVSPVLKEADQSWVLAITAFVLRALGRHTEAREPMQVALERRIKQEDWVNAATGATNLSQLNQTLGDVAAAVKDAERAALYGDRSGEAFRRLVTRAILGDILHQAGRRNDAEKGFLEAEQLQREWQPRFTILYSQLGFLHCDLLLDAPERAAWLVTSSAKTSPPAELVVHRATLQTVSERVTQTLAWAIEQNASLLTFALDYLTVARTALYSFILAEATADKRSDDLEAARRALNEAVSALRRSGQQDDLPRGLLSRAWLLHVAGIHTGPDSAQADLDEAWEIAERGPMRLHMADIHLYRARLFFRDATYPWESPEADLAAARKLIEECGYGRRKEELEDAEAALKQRS
jgi:hypothetical protein